MPRGMVCFSGGKDSTAMLLRMLELDDEENYPINRIVFADTDFEFPELYEYLDRIQAYLDEHYPERGLKVERVHAKKSWDDWFFGRLTRGKLEGKVRGAPLKVYPCWWSREAKLYPLQKAKREANIDYSYIGIAFDELERAHSTEDGARFPLVEWKWTEKDCMSYLDHLGLGLNLYTVFNRLGCFHCPKQPPRSWYSLWKHFPDLFETACEWDDKSWEISGHGFTMRDREEGGLREMAVKFAQGFIPKGSKGMECRSCDAVAFSAQGILKDDDFITDDAIERMPELMNADSGRYHLNEAEPIEWIPPSHANNEHIEAASMDNWFLPDLPDDGEESCMILPMADDDNDDEKGEDCVIF